MDRPRGRTAPTIDPWNVEPWPDPHDVDYLLSTERNLRRARWSLVSAIIKDSERKTREDKAEARRQEERVRREQEREQRERKREQEGIDKTAAHPSRTHRARTRRQAAARNRQRRARLRRGRCRAYRRPPPRPDSRHAWRDRWRWPVAAAGTSGRRRASYRVPAREASPSRRHGSPRQSAPRGRLAFSVLRPRRCRGYRHARDGERTMAANS